MFKITIAIPTFNRSKALHALLNNLVKQKNIEKIQVLVSDNGSTDETPKVLDTFTKLLNLKIVGFPQNLGFDKNYINCVQHSDGEYLWIMGDDDSLIQGAVDTVLNKIMQSECDLLIINGGDLRNNLLVPRIRYTVPEISSVDCLFASCGWHLCWIGTSVVRRTALKPELMLDGDWNAFIHIPLLARSFSEAWKVNFEIRALIHPTVNNSEYSKRPISLIRTFGFQLFETLNSLRSIVSSRSRKKTVRGFHKHLSMFDLRSFATWRRAETIDIFDFIKYIVYFQRVNPRSILYAPVFLISPTLLKKLFPKKSKVGIV